MGNATTKIILSREAARFLQAGTPRDDKLNAARGEALLEPAERVTTLFLLSQDADDSVRETARKTFDGLSEAEALEALDQGLAPIVIDSMARRRCDDKPLLKRIADLATTTDDTLAYLASLPHKEILEHVSRKNDRVLRSPLILEALGTNPLSSRATVDRILFLFGVGPQVSKQTEGMSEEEGEAYNRAFSSEIAAGLDAEDLPAELVAEELGDAPNEKRLDQKNLMTTIRQLTVFQKIKLALLGNKEARGILIRDRNKVVSTAAIRNPKIMESEVVTFCKSKELSEEVMRIIARTKEWTKLYQVQFGLASNPKTPLIYSLKFTKYLKERELRTLSKSREVPHQVTAVARKLLLSRRGER
jgi:hypothetical protein